MSSEDDDELTWDSKTTQVLHQKGYIFERLLSKGGYGQVHKGVNRNTGKPVAIKVINPEASGTSPSVRRKFLPRELTTLMTAKHAYLVHVHDVILVGVLVFICMEFADGGDMTGYLRKNGAIAEPKVARWFGQVASALHYLHIELRLAHRDVKLDNILLFTQGGDALVKLGDFGFATESWDWTNNRPQLSQTFCGTPAYYSIVIDQPYNPYASDCYAMGVTLFAMLNDRYPFHFEDHNVQYREQSDPAFLSNRFTKKFSADLMNLQLGLLVVEESKRMDIVQVVKHPWIRRKGK